MKNIVVINPRGIKGDEEYLNGFAESLQKHIDMEVTVYTNYYCEITDQALYELKKYFFKNSENMPANSYMRKIIRVIEYVYDYMRIVREVKKNKPEIIHIHWSIVSRIDYFVWKKLKKYTNKIIFTAHNVLPHIDSQKYIKTYGWLYNISDVIIVHGKNIFNEFIETFPQYANKVYISKHGKKKTIELLKKPFDEESEKYKEYLNEYNKIILCFGMIYYEKGFDRVVKVWKELKEHNNACLVIAGRVQKAYKELDELVDYMKSQPDVLFINRYISENFLSFLLTKANIIVIPYRHASMSGVMLTAAAASIPVICTDVGSLSEYITEKCGWLIKNDDDELRMILNEVINNMSNKHLGEVGARFRDYIDQEYNWDTIVDHIIKSCY